MPIPNETSPSPTAPGTPNSEGRGVPADGEIAAGQRGRESRYGLAAPLFHRSNDLRIDGLTTAQLRSLPVAFPFDPVVPAAFGISRSAAYRALHAGELPITPLRLGRRLVVKRSDLLTALGVEDDPPPPTSKGHHDMPATAPDPRYYPIGGRLE